MTTLACILLALSTAEGALAFTQEDPARIDDLIRKLGAEDYAEREKATAELKKIGKPAHDALRKAAESDDPEVRQRARELLEGQPRPEKPPAAEPRAQRIPPAFGFGQGRRGSSVSVQSVNGNTTYKITPAEGAPITFHKAISGQVKLEYTNEEGAARTAEAATLEAFLKDHKDLAAKYGITEKGIDYGGGGVTFQGGPFGGFNFPRELPRLVLPLDEMRGVSVSGAALERVSEALRVQLGLPEGGAVVTRVAPESPAEALGLRKHDILLEIDGRTLASPEAARGILKRESSVVVIRKGKRQTLAVRRDF